MIRYGQRARETGAAYHGRRRRRPRDSPETKGGRRSGDVRVDGRAGRGDREAVHWVEHGGGRVRRSWRRRRGRAGRGEASLSFGGQRAREREVV
jgi:hypothetical protein